MTKVTIPRDGDPRSRIFLAENPPDPHSGPNPPDSSSQGELSEAKAKAVVASRPRPTSTTPDQLKQISRRWLNNEPVASIAERLGLSVARVYYAIRCNVVPAWKDDLVVDAVATLAKLRHTAEIAWKDWRDDPGSAVASKMYRWAVDREIAITGQSAPQRVQIEQFQYRVAGTSQAQLEKKMLSRLAEKMQEMRRLSDDSRIIDVPQVPSNGDSENVQSCRPG